MPFRKDAMFETEIHTEIEINASAERVWKVLSDLSGYSEWNPMIRRASGDLKTGARLMLYFNPAGSKGRTFRPKLLIVEPNRELRWQGQPGVPMLFESEHIIKIEPINENKIRLVHDMVFYGLLIPLVRNRVKEAIYGPFEEMNRALKIRAEKK